MTKVWFVWKKWIYSLKKLRGVVHPGKHQGDICFPRKTSETPDILAIRYMQANSESK